MYCAHPQIKDFQKSHLVCLSVQADGSVYDDEEEGDEDGAASQRASSRGGAKTARGSEWGHTAIFSDAGGSQAGGDTK